MNGENGELNSVHKQGTGVGLSKMVGGAEGSG